MGRSSGACFKIIACGSGDSVDRDDLDASAESKGADKRGWSFRKRSARHRVLSNTVISETPSGNKQSLESTAIGFQAPADSTVSEKASEILWTGEAPRVSTSVNKAASVSTLGSEAANEGDTLVTGTVTEDDTLVPEGANEGDTLVPEGANEGDTLVPEGANEGDTLVSEGANEGDTLVPEGANEGDTLVPEVTNEGDTLVPDPAIEDESVVEVNPDEAATLIQAAVRRFLAQRALRKHKNTVKLQAAIRGHLVRRQAAGTLRCIRAIVRMQALVRARLSAQGFSTEDELQGNHENDNMKLTGTERSGTKQRQTYVSMEKLLRNAFARQLLETPKTRHCFKLDPEKTASAWKWLDMWMTASATEIEQSSESESNIEVQEQDKGKHAENQVESVIPSQDCSKPTAGKSDVEEATVPSQCKENLISHEKTSTPTIHYMEQPQPLNTSMSSTNDSDLFPGDSSHSVSQVDLNSLSSELEAEEPKRSMKRLAPEQADSDGRKFVFGSRKASNPAFIAAQSKFEELTSTSSSAKSISSSNQELGSDSCADAISSSLTDAIKTREVDQAENSVPHNSRVHVGGSDSGTELSISSTLDSPDRFEVANAEFEKESEVLAEEVGNPEDSNNLDQDKLEHIILGTELAYSISVLPENHDSGIGANSGPSKFVTNGDLPQVESKLEEHAQDAPIKLELDTGHQVFRSSPDASPRSHVTVPESQGTPASQVSANTKKSRSDKKGSSQKRKSLSASKRSPINPGMDSGVRSSMEQLPKDHKTAKRRNSFGSPRPDHVEQEPRDSSSSNSLPSYMQATESARAKALAANSSPRSSPDVHDKEIYIKKRHSLPGTNGRQGSPRIQRSMSQAQQSSKGSTTNERKWQR